MQAESSLNKLLRPPVFAAYKRNEIPTIEIISRKFKRKKKHKHQLSHIKQMVTEK